MGRVQGVGIGAQAVDQRRLGQGGQIATRIRRPLGYGRRRRRRLVSFAETAVAAAEGGVVQRRQ